MLGLGLALAGCGGSSSPDPVSKSSTPLALSAPRTVTRGHLAEVSGALDRRSGRIYVAWSTMLTKQAPSGWGPLGDVYVAWSDDGGKSFSAPVRVGRGGGEDFSGSPVNIGVTPKGTVVLDWEDNIADPSVPGGSGQFTIRVARSTNRGRSWTVSTQPPDGGKQLVSRPNLYVAPNGQVWLDWLDGRPVDRRIPEPLYNVDLSLSRNEGKTFSYSWVAKSSACQCCRPTLALGPHGLLALAWRDVVQPPGSEGKAEMDMSSMSSSEMKGMKMPAPSDVRDVKVATSPDDGREWSLGVKPHDDHWLINGCPIIGPSLYYTLDGKQLVVSWFTGAEGRVGVWTASSADNGASWSAPTRLSSSLVATGADIIGVPGPDGSRWSAWAMPRAVQAARISPGGELSETAPLPGVATGVAPALVAAPQGTLLLYIARSGAADRLLARRLGG